MIRRFLYKILLFCLPILALLLVVETYCRLERDRLLSESGLDKIFRGRAHSYAWVEKARHPKKVLLLGSSSVKYGLSCSSLQTMARDSFLFLNLAADARDPIETYFILKHLDLGNVHSVYMGIDPWIYTRAYYRNRDPYLYLDLDVVSSFRYSRELDPRVMPRRYAAWLKSCLGPQRSLPRDTVMPPGGGSAALLRPPVNFNEPVSEKFRLKEFGWSHLQFEYLAKIVALCREKGISFHAFYPPKRKDFIEDYEKNCRTVQASFIVKWKTAGLPAEILGSFSDLPDPAHDLYADAYHLNAKGQVQYSGYFFSHIFRR